MKKTFKTMLALMAGAMTFTGCTSDILENTPEQIPSAFKPMTFTATQESDATRTAIDAEDGVSINWTDGDKISIFDGASENCGNQAFTLDGEGGSTSGTFKGEAAEAITYYALYPYVESKSDSKTVTEAEAKEARSKVTNTGVSIPSIESWEHDWGGKYTEDKVTNQMNNAGISPENQAIILAYLKGETATFKSGPQRNESDQFENVVLPSVQTATAGSADPNAMLMIGTSDENNIQFKNVCAYLKVKPTFACSSIVFKSNGTENLAGTVTLGLDTDGVPTTTVTANGTNTVTLSGTIAANSICYIAVLPATLASGFTVEFKDADNKVLSSKSTAKDVTFARNKVINLGSFDAAPATTGTAKATIGGSEVDVNWVQLWAGGPKFAEYNVGVTDGKAESFGGYYTWAENIASTEWGSAWRMPTQAEFEALLANCDVEDFKYLEDEEEITLGIKYTGKGDYSSNSIFLPAAGYYSDGDSHGEGSGHYWSSTPDEIADTKAYYLLFYSSDFMHMLGGSRFEGKSVRAVLAE